LVDRLFKTRRHPSGREYTYFEVSLLMRGAIQPPHLHALRRGNSDTPTRKTILALCQFFGVPAAYFFPELDESPGSCDDGTNPRPDA
jgi:transcriptional regulator with XRE-family HTH domain